MEKLEVYKDFNFFPIKNRICPHFSSLKVVSMLPRRGACGGLVFGGAVEPTLSALGVAPTLSAQGHLWLFPPNK